jgi:Bacterial alpha-L-rhamnosidase concanavalin-like domain
MTPYGLSTEQRTEPLGLGEPLPRLSWKLGSERRGAAQTAYRITAATDAADRVLAEVAPTDVGRRRPGRFIVDFGQNLVGRVRLHIRGAQTGDRIVLRHAEVLDDGELYRADLRRAEAADVYVSDGAGIEVFEPLLTFHGFRYLEVTGYPGELSAADVVAGVRENGVPAGGATRRLSSGRFAFTATTPD